MKFFLHTGKTMIANRFQVCSAKLQELMYSCPTRQEAIEYALALDSREPGLELEVFDAMAHHGAVNLLKLRDGECPSLWQEAGFFE